MAEGLFSMSVGVTSPSPLPLSDSFPPNGPRRLRGRDSGGKVKKRCGNSGKLCHFAMETMAQKNQKENEIYSKVILRSKLCNYV